MTYSHCGIHLKFLTYIMWYLLYINKFLCSFLSKFTRCFQWLNCSRNLFSLYWPKLNCSMKFSKYESALETILFPIHSKLNCNSKFPRSENALETKRFPRHLKQNCNSKLSWQWKSLETHKIHAKWKLYSFCNGNRWEPCWKHEFLACRKP